MRAIPVTNAASTLLTPLLWLSNSLPQTTFANPAPQNALPNFKTNLHDPLPQPASVQFAFIPSTGAQEPLSVESVYMAAFNGLYTISLQDIHFQLPKYGHARDNLNRSTVIELISPSPQRRVDASIWAYGNIINNLPSQPEESTILSTSWWLGSSPQQPLLTGTIAYNDFAQNNNNNRFPSHASETPPNTTVSHSQQPNQYKYTLSYPTKSRPIDLKAFFLCALKIFKRVAVSNAVGPVQQNRAFTVQIPSQDPSRTTLTIAFRHQYVTQTVTWTELATALYEMRDFLREQGRWAECEGQLRDHQGRVIMLFEARLYGGGVEGEVEGPGGSGGEVKGLSGSGKEVSVS